LAAVLAAVSTAALALERFLRENRKVERTLQKVYIQEKKLVVKFLTS
jgi:hypothetical protein